MMDRHYTESVALQSHINLEILRLPLFMVIAAHTKRETAMLLSRAKFENFSGSQITRSA